MSADKRLVERLRGPWPVDYLTTGEAADRIEALEAVLRLALKKMIEDALVIENEFQLGRTLEELEACGELDPVILAARAALPHP